MKRRILLPTLFLLMNTVAIAQDAEGCKDHPMFPTRMSNYILSTCTSNFDAAEFWVTADASKSVTKEGTKTVTRYDFNAESGKQKPSVLQILRNYENAARKIGGTTMYLNTDAATAIFKIMKNGKEAAWVRVECGGNDSNDFVELTVVELADMEQEVSSTDMLTALNTDGHIALYINFDFGKATIKPESQPIIDQIVELLKANPTLKISVEGHTDNVGTPASNMTLSKERAAAVRNALIAKGTDQARLTSKGLGQDKPVAPNDSEEGRAKNRRVEIVKI